MSQLQFQCPASPMPAASAPLQLGQPQPGYSIPCASGTLPSESASQPIRSSALPAGSATPYNTTTGWIYLFVGDWKHILYCCNSFFFFFFSDLERDKCWHFRAINNQRQMPCQSRLMIAPGDDQINTFRHSQRKKRSCWTSDDRNMILMSRPIW